MWLACWFQVGFVLLVCECVIGLRLNIARYVIVMMVWRFKCYWFKVECCWFEGLSLGCIVGLRLNVVRCVTCLLVWRFKCWVGSFGLWLCCWFVHNYVRLLILVIIHVESSKAWCWWCVQKHVIVSIHEKNWNWVLFVDLFNLGVGRLFVVFFLVVFLLCLYCNYVLGYLCSLRILFSHGEKTKMPIYYLV